MPLTNKFDATTTGEAGEAGEAGPPASPQFAGPGHGYTPRITAYSHFSFVKNCANESHLFKNVE